MQMSSMPERREPDHAVKPSAEECIGMVWELTMNAWTSMGNND